MEPFSSSCDLIVNSLQTIVRFLWDREYSAGKCCVLFCFICQEIKATVSLIQNGRSNNVFAGMVKMMTKIDLRTKSQNEQLKCISLFDPAIDT